MTLLKDMTSISDPTIHVDARLGAHISHALWESLCLSVEQSTRVILTHNGKKYTLNPRKIIDEVYRRTEERDCVKPSKDE